MHLICRYKLPYCEKKSNLYVDVYCKNDIRIIISKMGTVKEILGNDKAGQVVYSIDVNY